MYIDCSWPHLLHDAKIFTNSNISKYNKSKCSNTSLSFSLLVSLTRAVENFCVMFLTFSKIRLHPIFIRPSLALTLSYFSFLSYVVISSSSVKCFCWSKTFFIVFFCHFYPQRNTLLHSVAIKVFTLLIRINLKLKVKIGISPTIMTEIFKFCDNATHNLRNGQVLESRYNRTNNFGVESISTLGAKI